MADATLVQDCYTGHYDLPVGCFFGNGTMTTGCDDAEKPVGDVCTETSGCGFYWSCTVNGASLDTAYPCDSVCTATAGEQLDVTATCDGTEDAANCETIYGAAPTSVNSTKCAASWSCFSDGNAATCNESSSFDTMCPVPTGENANSANANCYESTSAVKYACHDILGMEVAEVNCPASQPATSNTPEACVNDSGCSFDYRCVPGADATDFSAAVSCTDGDGGYGECTVDCTTATHFRSTACRNTDLKLDADEAKCSGTAPVTSESCETDPKITITDSPAVIVAGGSAVNVDFCYYGVGDATATPTDKAFATLVTSKYTYRVGSSELGSGSVSATAPKIAPADVSLRVTNKKGDVFNAANITVESLCSHGLDCGGANAGTCRPLDSTCICEDGYLGDECSITPCMTLDCVTDNITAECDNLAPTCACKEGFSGTRCEIDDTCATESALCKNKGYVKLTDGACEETCECVGNWDGDLCQTCSLGCNSGSADSGCTKCVCGRAASGDSCQCSVVYGIITFPTSFDITNSLFQTSFQADLALITGLPKTDFSFEVNSQKLIIAIISCPQTVNINRVAASWFIQAAADNAWFAIKTDIQSNDSLLKSGSLSGAADDIVVQNDLYDPTCTSNCAASPFPEDNPDEGSSDDTDTIIIAVVVSVVGVILLIVVGCIIKKKCCQPEAEHAYGEKETEMAYNNRISIYARPSIAVPAADYQQAGVSQGVPEAYTEDVVVAVPRGASPKNEPMVSQYSTVSGKQNSFGYQPPQ
jgi:hypothetical protein